MCEWCNNPADEAYCQDCGRQICKDAAPDDEYPAAVFVTSYGDVFCWDCGKREQWEIDKAEEAEADEWGWMEFDPYDELEDE